MTAELNIKIVFILQMTGFRHARGRGLKVGLPCARIQWISVLWSSSPYMIPNMNLYVATMRDIIM
jgi:hypothetical protein